MKLEIELDLNKIDYDVINKQIAEKVAALDIKNMYDVESKINNKITDLVKKEVDDSYNSYLDQYWVGTTSDGRRLIEAMTKTEIENHTKKVIDEIFTNEYNEESMRETMLQVIPKVFSSILFNRLESSLFNHEQSYYSYVHNVVEGEIASAINRMRY